MVDMKVSVSTWQIWQVVRLPSQLDWKTQDNMQEWELRYQIRQVCHFYGILRFGSHFSDLSHPKCSLIEEVFLVAVLWYGREGLLENIQSMQVAMKTARNQLSGAEMEKCVLL